MTYRIPCRKCGTPRPMKEVTTRFRAAGKEGIRIRFKQCFACKREAKLKKKEKVATV
jgi:hypothetical protein